MRRQSGARKESGIARTFSTPAATSARYASSTLMTRPPPSAIKSTSRAGLKRGTGSHASRSPHTMRRDSLASYRAKRDFSQTEEPAGKTSVPEAGQLRFVIQRHDATRLHYDFRLELDGTFKSWAVTRGPSLDPADKRLAVEVEDHPLDYGDFEGTIPKGQYGGGTVQLWDRGYWQVEGRNTPEEALQKGDLKFTLDGERLKGSWVLVRMRGDKFRGKKNNWLLIKHRDAEEIGRAS